ncbi:hypothetical protein CVT26_008834 [Gymnopilus dilepis]|uniref:Uncharacterized protein n=1 Tax=Gymnopilus dilepis TaxID=231916 RepID=A0A409X4D5_9AGAR|nr:hypothetical protein CVT26_008834 [Gymnopilus dilepis]
MVFSPGHSMQLLFTAVGLWLDSAVRMRLERLSCGADLLLKWDGGSQEEEPAEAAQTHSGLSNNQSSEPPNSLSLLLDNATMGPAVEIGPGPGLDLGEVGSGAAGLGVGCNSDNREPEFCPLLEPNVEVKGLEAKPIGLKALQVGIGLEVEEIGTGLGLEVEEVEEIEIVLGIEFIGLVAEAKASFFW